MILVREVFQLEFGKAKEAVALWQEGIRILQKAGYSYNPRLLTDVTGPSYLLVLESTFPGLAEYEKQLKEGLTDPQWRERYPKVVPLVESSRREIFTVVEQ